MTMTMTSIDQFPPLVGKEIGTTKWATIDQGGIDAFADVTGDRNWIHTDPKVAAAEGPFGSTIAHGFLTLSLLSRFIVELVDTSKLPMALNYGLERVRFITPVRVDSRVRMRLTITSVEPVGEALNVVFDCVVEVEDQERPALVAQVLWRFYRDRVVR
jgi:acyl dehydratase